VQLKQEFAAARARWADLTLYQQFEQVIVLILTGVIAVVILFSVWNLVLKVVPSIVVSHSFDPTDYSVFQAIFGMIITVIIALEFKRSLLVLEKRQHNVVQVRSVILIALLAVVRKLLIIDVGAADWLELVALATAILALGAVYWVVGSAERFQTTRQCLSKRESAPQPPRGVAGVGPNRLRPSLR
jgi:uncharacterized membrane protein (DUF373 family)